MGSNPTATALTCGNAAVPLVGMAAFSSNVSAEQYEQLPAWYREKLRRRAEETIARRDAEQAAARRVA